MEHAQFWSLVDGAAGSATALGRALAALPAGDKAGFQAWWWEYYGATRREDLWAAVYAIRGGCSDDSFDYFRGWLIGRGEAAVLAAIRDPETLVELIGDSEPSDEGMLSVAHPQPHDKVPDAAIPGRAAWPADRVASGVKWTKPFYAAQFPALYARFVASWPDPPVGAIDHARYRAIVEQARGDVDALAAILRGLSREQLVGFDRWHATYNRALMRVDVRVACRLVLGKDDSDTLGGFRGWLMMRGPAAVADAMRDLDATVAASPRPASRWNALFVTWPPLEALGIYDKQHDTLETIPDADRWRADWDVQVPTAAQVRERFPQLTAGKTDRQLGGPVDVSQMTSYERQRLAGDVFERAKACTDDAQKLAELDRAIGAWPQHVEARGLRGRTHARLGNTDAALADFDAVLVHEPEAAFTHWERSKVRLARGDRDGAIADARAAATRVDEAKLWLASLVTGTPRRVRHAKFGDGTVVSVDDRGSDPKLVIDFAGGRKTIARRFVEAIDEPQ